MDGIVVVPDNLNRFLRGISGNEDTTRDRGYS